MFVVESVGEFLKSVNIWQSYEQERGCLVRRVQETTTFLFVTLPSIHRF